MGNLDVFAEVGNDREPFRLLRTFEVCFHGEY